MLLDGLQAAAAAHLSSGILPHCNELLPLIASLPARPEA